MNTKTILCLNLSAEIQTENKKKGTREIRFRVERSSNGYLTKYTPNL